MFVTDIVLSKLLLEEPPGVEAPAPFLLIKEIVYTLEKNDVHHLRLKNLKFLVVS